MTTRVKDKDRQIYLGMVSAMDEAIGGIIEKLKVKKIFDQTVFVFTSDNGGFTNGGGRNKPFRGQKRTNWQGGIKGRGAILNGFIERQ